MTKEQEFYDAFREVFVGYNINGKTESGYINLMKIKSSYFNEIFKILKDDIEKRLKKFPDFREELFDKLYSFFKNYFSKTGSIYFNATSLNDKIYDQIYTEDKDVILFWKTKMLYYVKSEKSFRNLEIKIKDVRIKFDISNLKKKEAHEKFNLIYKLKEVETENVLVLEVIDGRSNQRTKLEEILKELKKRNIKINENDLENAFGVFEKQSKVDYFINKNVKKFLREQFDLWLYHYIFKGESNWNTRRIEELQILKNFTYKIIDFISQFEEELVRIWNKPKFVLKSNYVITLNKIAQKNLNLVKKILKHKNLDIQIEEWKKEKIVKKDFKAESVFNESSGKLELSKKFRYLPIDSKYFKDLKFEILELFNNLEENLDGYLINSENYQAMNTILPKFKEKIQTIYWDPPFNTGREFAYLDRFQDSTWLTLMENRLNKNRDFLKQKGSIFIHLDENANFFGRILLDRTFGDENFRAEITNFLGYNMKREINPEKFIVQKETILHYSKSENYIFNKIAKIKDRYLIGLKGMKKKRIENEYLDFFKSLLKNENDIKLFGDGLFQAYSPNLIIIKDKIKEKGRTKTIIEDILIPIWKDGTFHLRSIFEKIEIDDEWDEKYFINVVGDVWLDIYSFRMSTINFKENEGFETQKPEKLMARIILSTSNSNDIVMDPFLGTGTTAAVAQKLNRKWIGIEKNKDTFYKIILPRMKRVISGDKSGVSNML
ncbi:MAG: DNA methyltransferase, partial [Candidatus Lokiarchaeota archaeon]